MIASNLRWVLRLAGRRRRGVRWRGRDCECL